MGGSHRRYNSPPPGLPRSWPELVAWFCDGGWMRVARLAVLVALLVVAATALGGVGRVMDDLVAAIWG